MHRLLVEGARRRAEQNADILGVAVEVVGDVGFRYTQVLPLRELGSLLTKRHRNRRQPVVDVLVTSRSNWPRWR